MKKLSLAIMILVVALTSCKKTPEVNLKYVDVERDLITVGTTTATVQCDYQYIATLKKAYFHYGEGQNEADMNTAEMRVVQNTLYVDLVGLKENTTYSYYYEFYNGFNSMRTEAKTFKTEASPIVVTLPTVITAEVTEITENSAQCGGEVTNDGGAEVTERGICWSTNVNPTLSDNYVVAGSGLGAFTALMDSLQDNTIYHVRAYATNETGTAYGLDREFATLVYVPERAINGLFTVDSIGHKVYFSQGNLQYQASTNTWRFAEHQWDYVGCYYQGHHYGTVSGSDNSLISSSYDGWIDLFGWGTSGWDNGNVYYRPYDYEYLSDSTASSQGYGYGPTDGTSYIFNLTDNYANADWGVYNAISNGGDTPNQWRTMKAQDNTGGNGEWFYVFERRTTKSGIRYAKATVNSVNGIVLLPDAWNPTCYTLNYPNMQEVAFTVNEISAEDWAILEANGAVFLPSAGRRNGIIVGYLLDGYGFYRSASCGDAEGSYGLYFGNSHVATICYTGRYEGESVRLVQDANK